MKQMRLTSERRRKGQSRAIGVEIGDTRTKFFSSPFIGNFPSAAITSDKRSVPPHSHPVIVGRQLFLVGKEAQTKPSSTRQVITCPSLGSSSWFANLGYALFDARFNPGEPNALVVVGIDNGLTSKERKTILDRIPETAVTICSDGDNRLKRFYFDRMNMLFAPEALGIFYHYLSEHPDASKQNIVVVDVGYHVVSLAFISNGECASSRKVQWGAAEEAEQIAELGLTMVPPKHLHPDHIADYVIDGSLFQPIGANYVTGARHRMQAFCDKILSIVKAFIASIPKRPDVCILAGNGAGYLAGNKGLGHQVTLIPRCDISKAIGFWHLASRFSLGAICPIKDSLHSRVLTYSSCAFIKGSDKSED